jgi:cytochrome c oxidase subunit 3
VSDLVTSEEQHPPAVVPPSWSRSTGQFGVIVFLASDVMLFAPFFAAYFLLRADNQPWPPPGVELDVPRALVATLVLLSSSFTMVASDRAGVRPGGAAPMRRWLLVTIGLGLVFLVNQILEYRSLDFGADSNPYGSAYVLLTGLHALHVTAGLGAMSMLFVRSVRSRGGHEAIESWAGGVSLFWHLVDLIWLFVFSTIWLLQ